MRKNLLLLLMCFSLVGYAQKGMQGIGVDGSFWVVGGDVFSGGLKLKYQYNAHDFIRLEPSMTFFFKSKENFHKGSVAGFGDLIDGYYGGYSLYSSNLYHTIYGYHDSFTVKPSFSFALNSHLFLWRPTRFRTYVIAGVGFMMMTENELYPGDLRYDSTTECAGGGYNSWYGWYECPHGETSEHSIYNNVRLENIHTKHSKEGHFMFNVGIGFDYRLSYKLSMNLETSYCGITGVGTYDDLDDLMSTMFVNLGLTYNF